MIGVSTDSYEEMEFWEGSLASGVLLVADPESRIIESYGLDDVSIGEEVARPATYVVDADGRLVWRHLPEDWRLRLSADEYLQLIEAYAP